MNLILAAMAQCGDSDHRRQDNIDGSAQCRYMHTGSDHWSICRATREAEEGKASNVVRLAASQRGWWLAKDMAAPDSKGKKGSIPDSTREYICKGV